VEIFLLKRKKKISPRYLNLAYVEKTEETVFIARKKKSRKKI